MPRRPPGRTAYDRAIAGLGPARPWASLSREEKIALTSERLRRFYEQAIAEDATPYRRARAAIFFAATLDRLVELTPEPLPSMTAVEPTPEALGAFARRVVNPKPLAPPRRAPSRCSSPATRWWPVRPRWRSRWRSSEHRGGSLHRAGSMPMTA
ncbi:MAG: hypothetical protein HYY76_14705 [Acidobacteria bacterium]|nr:hypothetical protein [Acidobacteriota bacterium]